MTGEKKMKITRTLTLSCLAVATLFGTSLVETSMADPLDKSSPKIAHGMYRDRGKSSPKIAHGMYRDRGKSSPKIAHGMYRDRGKSSPKIAEGAVDIMEENIAGRTRRAPVTINMVDMVDLYFDLLAVGEYELADEVGVEVEDLVRELGSFGGRR
jgi:hypothetical protein